MHVDRYCVVGHPIAHSKSPLIHREFAQQTQQTLEYEALLAPLDGFTQSLDDFFQNKHGKGANVTVPFKRQAVSYANVLTERAKAADAVNTLIVDGANVIGDNTDGIGLVNDVCGRHQLNLAGLNILILGAGGAARGVILPLLAKQPAQLVIANRSLPNAQALGEQFDLPFYTFDTVGNHASKFDIIINATASGLADEAPQIPRHLFEECQCAYDMMYGAQATAFMAVAIQQQVPKVADGLGMLVEQAAAAFHLWRGVLPQTEPVYQKIRQLLTATA